MTLVLLTGCATSSGRVEVPQRVPLASVPQDIRQCFAKLVPAPKKGEMTDKEVIALIGKLRTSEVAKSRCGKRLLRIYDTQTTRR